MIGRDRLAIVLQDAGEQVLCRGLAVGTGDPDDLQLSDRTHARDDRSGEIGQSAHSIRHDDLRNALVDHVLDEGENGAVLDSGTDESVPVGLGAGFGDEDAAGGHVPRIGVDDAAHHGVGGVGADGTQLTAGDGGELGERQGDHGISMHGGMPAS